MDFSPYLSGTWSPYEIIGSGPVGIGSGGVLWSFNFPAPPYGSYWVINFACVTLAFDLTDLSASMRAEVELDNPVGDFGPIVSADNTVNAAGNVINPLVQTVYTQSPIPLPATARTFRLYSTLSGAGPLASTGSCLFAIGQYGYQS